MPEDSSRSTSAVQECEEEGCEEPATTRLNWPGHGYINYCDEHAEKASAIAGSLGMGLGRGPF